MPGLKSITVNKQKLNNKHTQKHKNLRGSANCLPLRRWRRNFTIKLGRYNSAQEHSQKTQIPIHPNSLSPTRQENSILLLIRLLLTRLIGITLIFSLVYSIQHKRNIYIYIYIYYRSAILGIIFLGEFGFLILLDLGLWQFKPHTRLTSTAYFNL